MADKKKGFFAGTVLGLGVAAAAAVGVGVQWPAAMAADAVNAPLIKASTAPIFAPPPGAPLSFADIFERVAPAVVSIDVTTHLSQAEMREMNPFQGLPLPFQANPRGGQGGDDGDDDAAPAPKGKGGKAPKKLGPEVQASGSGFFISADGYLVTNNHVVANAETIKVTLNDKRQLTARVIGRDESTDLAVLKVDGGNFPFVNFESIAKPRVGDWVLAIGNPLGLGGTATAGIVSTIGRSLVGDASSAFVDYIQIDAPINRGNSGGPTFDIYGRVIGVNTAIYSPNGGSIGIGFDIPADVVANITQQLMSGGKITRGYLGVTIQNVTPDIAESLGLKPDQGALVSDVVSGGPGEKGGMHPGDLVLEVNGHSVTSNSDLTRQVAMAHAGDTLHLVVLRDGKRLNLDVKSGTRPAESQLALNGGSSDEDGAAPGVPERPRALRPVVLGMGLAPLDDAARRRFNLGATAHGVVVESVSQDSPAGRVDIRPGDVIVRAGNSAAVSPSDIVAAVAEANKASRSGVFVLINRDGRNAGLSIKFDSQK